MSIFFTGRCLVATLKYDVTTLGIHNKKKLSYQECFFLKIVCTKELEVLLGPKVASLSVRGKNNKIPNPVPVVMMHLLWEHPRPWVLPHPPPPTFFFWVWLSKMVLSQHNCTICSGWLVKGAAANCVSF
jgi:hypothetical protein